MYISTEIYFVSTEIYDTCSTEIYNKTFSEPGFEYLLSNFCYVPKDFGAKNKQIIAFALNYCATFHYLFEFQGIRLVDQLIIPTYCKDSSYQQFEHSIPDVGNTQKGTGKCHSDRILNV